MPGSSSTDIKARPLLVVILNNSSAMYDFHDAIHEKGIDLDATGSRRSYPILEPIYMSNYNVKDKRKSRWKIHK